MTEVNHYFSQVYGACDYGTSTAQNGTCQTGASTGGGSSSSGNSASGGTLANTGFDVLLAATIACAIIFVALVVRFWRRSKTSTSNS